jgi:2,3-bisphosphoglycerate-dependent phosphoglycerate mutase
MSKLYLQRHLKSQWNLENKFTGWTDVPLSEEGVKSAKDAAEKLAGVKIDEVFTSPLKRNSETVTLILKNLGLDNLPILADKALNERDYGNLTGMNKDDAKKEYGEEQVRLWRRSWDTRPPGGESLKDTFDRAVPFFKNKIETELKAGKDVLVVSSGNALRSIVKYIENIADEKIIDFEIPFGGLVKYDFDNGKYSKFA